MLANLSALDSPHSWDLCEQHAIRLAPPMGWDLVREWVPESEREPESPATAEISAGLSGATVDDMDVPGFEAHLDQSHLDHSRLESAQPGMAQHDASRTDDGPWFDLRGASEPARRAHLRIVTPADTE